MLARAVKKEEIFVQVEFAVVRAKYNETAGSQRAVATR